VAVLGLSVLLARSPEALTAVRLVGAAYLVYLGVRTIWSARRSAVPTSAPTSIEPDPRAAFVHGFLTNLLNPKAVLFFAAILPQFVVADAPVTAQIAALGAVDVVIGVLLWPLVVAFGVRLGALLGRPAVRRGWDRVTGGVFVGLGGALAVTEV
ncbi:MAG: LysE family translocator, partial [Pseudonocardia sp.]|nr:LysE family translocator [Pseudonocardia sp.]